MVMTTAPNIGIASPRKAAVGGPHQECQTGLRTSLTAAEWPREVRYFWVLLWGYLDDHGRGVDEPRLIKADCFPLDDDLTATDIDKWLESVRHAPR